VTVGAKVMGGLRMEGQEIPIRPFTMVEMGREVAENVQV
jgi:hypothetical protein